MEKLTALLQRNKYVWLVFALGLALLLLPRSTSSILSPEPTEGMGEPMTGSGIPLDTESARLEALLSRIAGAGETHVLLSQNGAVVVCAGADNAEVCLDVTNAVSAYTGLGSDKIRVMRLEKQ